MFSQGQRYSISPHFYQSCASYKYGRVSLPCCGGRRQPSYVRVFLLMLRTMPSTHHRAYRMFGLRSISIQYRNSKTEEFSLHTVGTRPISEIRCCIRQTKRSRRELFASLHSHIVLSLPGYPFQDNQASPNRLCFAIATFSSTSRSRPTNSSPLLCT